MPVNYSINAIGIEMRCHGEQPPRGCGVGSETVGPGTWRKKVQCRRWRIGKSEVISGRVKVPLYSAASVVVRSACLGANIPKQQPFFDDSQERGRFGQDGKKSSSVVEFTGEQMWCYTCQSRLLDRRVGRSATRLPGCVGRDQSHFAGPAALLPSPGGGGGLGMGMAWYGIARSHPAFRSCVRWPACTVHWSCVICKVWGRARSMPLAVRYRR
ncbi:hypothetical protein EJ06DRAFT_61902 [Trichodelitschia bisporula]|uniref:Uncharacterized protein n=1 Tax=Trichodelitschia bisporula TaxID=703511 RepID=A0A6G1HUI1_9PEZI|nr:hypothetical protein EJ06DRAFT_61902 [Trichodelitschia bisporula]